MAKGRCPCGERAQAAPSIGGVDQYQYLMLMAACLLLTLPLELVIGARVWRRPRRLLGAVAVVVAIFGVWDVVGIVRGHWTYSERYTTGVLLPFEMPLEELVFFVVIPICGLLTYEAVGTLWGRLLAWRRPASSSEEAR